MALPYENSTSGERANGIHTNKEPTADRLAEAMAELAAIADPCSVATGVEYKRRANKVLEALKSLRAARPESAPASAEGDGALTDEQIDLIAADGMRNAAGGIYEASVYAFARACIAAATQGLQARIRSLSREAWEWSKALEAVTSRMQPRNIIALPPLPPGDRERVYAGHGNEEVAETFSATHMREYARQAVHEAEEAWHARAAQSNVQPKGTQEAVPAGVVQVPSPISEDMHVAACKVLTRAHGLDGLPQRMLDAMRAAAPAQVPAPVDLPSVEEQRELLKRLRHYGDNDRDAACALIERLCADLYAAEGRTHSLAQKLAEAQGCINGWVTFGGAVTDALGLRVMYPKQILAEIARLRAAVHAEAAQTAAPGALSDEQIAAAWDAWPRTAITSRRGAVEFVRNLPAPAVAAGWLPMESAPRARGARFIGRTPSGRAVTAEPMYCVYDGPAQLGGWHEVERGSLIPQELTGWMPFPGGSVEIEGTLYEHEDGRQAVSFVVPAPFSDGDPKWHRVGPVQVHAGFEPPAEADGPGEAIRQALDALESASQPVEHVLPFSNVCGCTQCDSVRAIKSAKTILRAAAAQ